MRVKQGPYVVRHFTKGFFPFIDSRLFVAPGQSCRSLSPRQEQLQRNRLAQRASSGSIDQKTPAFFPIKRLCVVITNPKASSWQNSTFLPTYVRLIPFPFATISLVRLQGPVTLPHSRFALPGGGGANPPPLPPRFDRSTREQRSVSRTEKRYHCVCRGFVQVFGS
ncbi:uncharacterized protein PV09_05029 [Verruconis gallopava]|uniref:Uncharacterized protein n=1 Tax=Verruconis gallopava TaxID=253628 RepID=A0A0D2AAT8_9PEZI|nr:uncharacterized protein PV09_05029 [Verruconis gallopava]KIW03720.1 hypothetical protein PV09_05029 [Verruconis gallopava]